MNVFLVNALTLAGEAKAHVIGTNSADSVLFMRFLSYELKQNFHKLSCLTRGCIMDTVCHAEKIITTHAEWLNRPFSPSQTIRVAWDDRQTNQTT